MSDAQPAPGRRALEPRADGDEPTPVPTGWQVARIGGVPVVIGGGWLVIALAMVALFGPRIALELPSLGPWAYAVAAAYAVLLLFSVLVHEGSHAVVAHRCGYRVNHVVADLMGGHTAYDASRATPGRSALVAAVGPLSNGLLALVGVALLPLTQSGVSTLLVGAFAWTNGVVAVFNLLPGLPLDGGFLLEALVWGATGRRHVGLLVAGWSGRLVTVVAVLWGVGLPLLRGGRPSTITLVWVLLVAVFLWRGASQAVSAGRLRRDLAGLRLSDVARPVRILPGHATLRSLAGVPGTPDDPPRAAPVVVLAAPDGRPLGHLDAEAIRLALAAGDLDASLESCLRVQPATWTLAQPSEPGAVEAVVAAMAQRGLSVVLLTDDAATATAVVEAATIDEALLARS